MSVYTSERKLELVCVGSELKIKYSKNLGSWMDSIYGSCS